MRSVKVGLVFCGLLAACYLFVAVLWPSGRNYLFQHAYGRGSGLLARQDPAGAAAEFRRALRLQPNNAEARYWLAVALQRNGETGEARRLFVALAPTHKSARAMLTRINRKPDWGVLRRTVVAASPASISAAP